MRRTLDQTRTLLLRTGLERLHARGLFVAVTHVRLADVARDAGMTTGAAYRVWERQEDFHLDLAVEAIRHRSDDTLRETLRAITKLVDGRAPLAEVLRLGAAAHLYANRPDDPFLIALSLRTLGSSVPALEDAARERHAASMAAFEQLYQVILDRYERRMRSPLGIEALSHALAALSEGFAIQSLSGIEHLVYELDDLPAGVGREWSLLGLAVEGVVERLTEPLSEPRPTT